MPAVADADYLRATRKGRRLLFRNQRLVTWAVLVACLAAAPLVRLPDVQAQGRASLAGRIRLLTPDGSLIPAQDAIVWLPDPSPASSGRPASSGPLVTHGSPASGRQTLGSRSKRFAPHVVVAATGATIDFPNFDGIFHNAFSVSPGNQFDLGLYRRGASKSVTFSTPGLVRVYCNIHQDMAAYVYVFDRALAAVTDEQGAFRLADLPPGRQQLHVWHEMGGETEAAVDLSAGQEQSWTFQLDARQFRREAHKNKYGQAYPPVRRDVDRY